MCLSILSFHTPPRWAWTSGATSQPLTQRSQFPLLRCPPILSKRRRSPMALPWASRRACITPSHPSAWWSSTGTSIPTSSAPTPSLRTPRGERQTPPSLRLSRRACKRYQERQLLCVCVCLDLDGEIQFCLKLFLLHEPEVCPVA